MPGDDSFVPLSFFQRQLGAQFLRFVMVGIVNTAFSYIVYAICIYSGLSYVIASLIGLVFGILLSFKTHGTLVFKNPDRRLFFLFLINWLLIYACMIGLIATMKGVGINEYWAGFLAMPPLAVISYLSQKFIVFGRKSDLISDSLLPLPFYVKNYKHFVRKLMSGSKGGLIQYGAHSYGIPLIRWWGEEANLRIGKFCSIAKGVEIFLGGNHRTDWISTYPFPARRNWSKDASACEFRVSRGDVFIGNDVWIGSGAVVLSGVTIGNGAVIGARAVVTRNVPDYAVVAGNPARVVRMRFSEEQISLLNKVAWWNWDLKKIRSNVGRILSSNIDEFTR